MSKLLLSLLLLFVVLLLAGCGAEQGVVIITATPQAPTDMPQLTQTPWVITATPAEATPALATNTPADEPQCAGLPGAGFEVKNANPCLIGSVQDEAPDGTPQCRPEQFMIFSDAVTGDGYADQYSAHAPITCTGNGYTFPLALINGEWGYTTMATTLAGGCHILKITGTAQINDPEHAENYMAAAYLQISGARGEIELYRQQQPLDDNFEIFWPFNVRTPASIFSTATLIAAWGTAMEDSTITLRTFSVAEAPDGFCEAEVPEL